MSDILKDHLEQVVNKTWNFSGRLQDHKDHIVNAVLGLGGEAGEVVDLHKKMLYHSFSEQNTPNSRIEELKGEMGDVIYYWLKIIDLYKFDVEEILKINRNKLVSRHTECFVEKEEV